MKVNVNVEIGDAQRNVLATLIVGKPIKRLATRDEVRDYVAGCIASLVEDGVATEPTAVVSIPLRPASTGDLSVIDPEDEEILRGKDPGYVVGWNRWKKRREK